MSLFPAYSSSAGVDNRQDLGSSDVGDAVQLSPAVDGFRSVPSPLSDTLQPADRCHSADDGAAEEPAPSKCAVAEDWHEEQRKHSGSGKRKKKKSNKEKIHKSAKKPKRDKSTTPLQHRPPTEAGYRGGSSAGVFLTPADALFFPSSSSTATAAAHVIRVDRRPDAAQLAFPATHYSTSAWLPSHLHRRRRCGRSFVLGDARSAGDDDGDGRSRRKPRYFTSTVQRRLRAAPLCVRARLSGALRLRGGGFYLPLTTDLSGECAGDDRDDGDGDETTAAVRQLNQQLSERPHDAALWLRFVRQQRRQLLVQGGCGRRQLHERQLAIVQRAVAACAGSQQLQLLRLRLLQQLASSQTDWQHLHAEWRRLLALWPNRPAVWNRYLRFVHHAGDSASSGGAYGGGAAVVAAAVAAHGRCLVRMRQFQLGSILTHTRPPHLVTFMISVVHRLCLLLRNAGYSERAVAIYQALLELNFTEPPPDGDSSAAWHDLLPSFEIFWDSRLPRVGEATARGWRCEMASRGSSSQVTADVCEGGGDDDDDGDGVEQKIVDDVRLSVAEKWLRLESWREERQWLPWQGRGREDECEDMERIVLFEHISQFLFRVDGDQDRCRLVLGLFTLMLPDEWHHYIDLLQQRLYTPADHGVQRQTSDKLIDQEENDNSKDSINNSSDADEDCWWNWTLPGELLPASTANGVTSSGANQDARRGFVVAVLQHCWPLFDANSCDDRRLLQMLYLRVQLRRGAGQRRAVRQLLRAESACVPLFVEYASGGCRSGESPAAGAVRLLETTLRQPGVASAVTAGRFQLLARLMRLRAAVAAAEHSSSTAAVLWARLRPQLLADVAQVMHVNWTSKAGVSSAAVLAEQQPSEEDGRRLLHRLCQQLDAECSSTSVPAAEATIDRTVDLLTCVAWTRLATGASLTTAAAGFTAFLAAHDRRRVVVSTDAAASVDVRGRLMAEAVLYSQCEFLADAGCHTAGCSWRRLLQVALVSALRRCPGEPRLSLLAARHQVDATSGGSRSLWWLHSNSDDVTCPLLEAATVAHRLVTSQGADDVTRLTEARRVRRRLANRLLCDEQLAGAAALWTLAVHVEMLVQPQGVDLLCHRAVHACPGEKRLYLCGAALDGRVARWCHLAAHSGVRVRTPVEELDVLLQREPEQEQENDHVQIGEQDADASIDSVRSQGESADEQLSDSTSSCSSSDASSH